MLAWLNRLLPREALFSAHGTFGYIRKFRVIDAGSGIFPTHHGSGNRPASKFSVEHSADKRGFEHKLPFRHR